LHLPPLRERRADIPLLVDHFLARMNARMGLSVTGTTPEALRLLVEYDWPGNVRELENCVERSIVLCEGPQIDADALPERLRHAQGAAPLPPAGEPENDDLSIKRASRRSEEALIRRALLKTRGNRTRAAELLEISHRALLYKIKEYAIHVPRDPASAADAGQDTPPPITPTPPVVPPSGDSTWRGK
jgi:two-component system response regulator AtoC